MKKRILTILLAGLLTVSATSCVINPSENPGTTGTGTPTSTTTNNNNPGTTAPDQFQEVNEAVYAVVDNLNLRISADTQQTSIAKQVPFKTELQRIGVNSTWSKVKYNGEDTVYYVSTAYLTTDDIAIKHFTAHADKTMYATEAVKVRHYPSTHTELSKSEHILKTLQKNEAVTVVGTGNGWYQVKIDSKLYYVSSAYLSTTQISTQDGLGDYIQAFKNGAYTQPQIMYIATDGANVRKYPSADNSFSLIIDTYAKGTAVTVVAQASINERLWAQISVPDATDPAAPAAKYYISLDCLSATQGGSSLDLAQTLAIYPNFKTYTNPTTKTMYVSNTVEASLAVRTSPSIPDGNDKYTNCIDSTLWPKAKAELTVVAYGTGTHVGWYIISYQNGFYFVSSAFITPNANGTPVLTIDMVLATYSTISSCTETEMKILKPTNYYSAPTMQNDDKLGTFNADDRVTVIARGTVGAYDIYVIKGADGNCWFITSDPTNVTPVEAT